MSGEAVGAPTPPFTVLSEEDAPKVDLTDPDAKEVGFHLTHPRLQDGCLVVATQTILFPKATAKGSLLRKARSSKTVIKHFFYFFIPGVP